MYQYDVRNTHHDIGIVLSKRIIGLHKGTLSVQSRQAIGNNRGHTLFTLTLKKDCAHFTPEQVQTETLAKIALPKLSDPTGPKEIQPGSDPETSDAKRLRILLVESHADLRKVIRESLSDSYAIIETPDGRTAWEEAITNIPDLVISDVMMTEMNGLELCQRLKSDERTSHVPVVLLSAQKAVKHIIEGLEIGADCYIVKPFNPRILALNVKNLLHTQERMRERYARIVTLGASGLSIDSGEEQFLENIVATIEKNISDTSFGVEKLAREVGMSTPILYKKLKGLTGMSVNKFTNTLRLQRAAQLLEQRRMNVNEVAIAVGYEDRRYFSREFRKMFGHTPNEYKKKESKDGTTNSG